MWRGYGQRIWGPHFPIKPLGDLLMGLNIAIVTSDDELINFLVQKLKEKHVIGLFRGRMEFGPRALGQTEVY